MNISATSIRNKEVNLDVGDLKKLLSCVVYPAYLRGFNTLSVMIVCVRREEHQHDAYVHQGKPYISIALNYDAVAGLSHEEITVISKNELVAYLDTLSGLPDREVV